MHPLALPHSALKETVGGRIRSTSWTKMLGGREPRPVRLFQIFCLGRTFGDTASNSDRDRDVAVAEKTGSSKRPKIQRDRYTATIFGSAVRQAANDTSNDRQS